MNITRFTDYSLRVLIYVALNDKELVTIKSISEQYKISKNHLMKIVQELNTQGYLQSIRGKNGGIKLGKPANSINVGDLIRHFEANSTLVECFGDNNLCIITPACKLKAMFADAMEAFYESLSQYTIADLVKGNKKKQLRRLLFYSAD